VFVQPLAHHTLSIQLVGRYYAVHLGIELRTKAPDQENKQFLHALMDRLEKVCSQFSLTVFRFILM
jgi:hypothetical protein